MQAHPKASVDGTISNKHCPSEGLIEVLEEGPQLNGHVQHSSSKELDAGSCALYKSRKFWKANLTKQIQNRCI